MEFNGQRVNVSVSAADAKEAEIFDTTGFFDVSEGRQFNRNESTSVLIGNNVGTNYFDEEINIRKQIKINGENFKVIGILKPQAQSFGGGPDTGNTIYLPIEGFKRISDNLSPGIIFAIAESKSDVVRAAEDIEDLFEDKYGEDSVTVSTTEQLLDNINSLVSVLTIFVMGLGGISLVVGGIGIMNAMITSVLERTKEIGLMKALGASNKKILTIFLLESAFIGMVGGIIGILVGFGLAELIAFIGTESGFALTAVKNIDIIIGALFFGVLVGVASGFYPAKKAAALDPVEALRTE
jgi:putative ABC transport system permease protein